MMHDKKLTNNKKELWKREPNPQLEALAKELYNQINELRTPFIIEFSGTPKAGKTKSMESIHLWFRRYHMETFTITERAAICPLRNKKDPTFNIWTGCSIVIKLLESLERQEKIIFFDRGIFDIITWMEFHKYNGVLSEDELINIRNFYLNERFTKHIKIVIVLTTDPVEAIDREYKDQITNISGAIMNERVLESYNKNLEYCTEKYGSHFNKIITYDTSKNDIRTNLANITLEIGKTIKELIDEEIAVVPRSIIIDNFNLSTGILFEKQKVYDLLYRISQNVIWIRRSQAEQSSDYIQLIPVSLFSYKNEILVITNRGFKHDRMAEHISIWAGGHSRRSDHNAEFSIDFLRHTLARELSEELRLPENELHLDKMNRNIPKYPVAFVWDNYNPKSARHLGIFYKMYQSKINTNLNKREFREGPSKSLYCEFKPINNDLTFFKPWETWSKIYLKNVHNLDFPEEEGQLHLL